MHKLDSRNSSSKFAWLTEPGRYVRPMHDIVVADNDHFVAMPSLGSLVPGWTLLVPCRAMTTLSQMNTAERQSLSALKADIATRLGTYGLPIYTFEHGGASGSLVSCGVDQAHLHLVPLDFNLLEAARIFDFGWTQSVEIFDLSEAEAEGQEYLFVEQGGVSLIGFPKTPISQWFRQLIARESGVDEWDYKKNPNIKQLKATAAALIRSR